MPVSLLSYALFTEADAYAYLKLTEPASESQQDVVRQMINAATEEMERVLARPIKARDRTEVYDGGGAQSLWLRYWPVVSITSLSRLDEDGDVDESHASTDYWYVADTGEIRMKSGVWFQAGNQNYEVVYSAGWSTPPDDLVLECKRLFARMYGDWDKQRDDIESMTVEGQTVRIRPVGVRDEVKKRWRIPGIAVV